jgi:hypothetical protein
MTAAYIAGGKTDTVAAAAGSALQTVEVLTAG